MQIPQRRTHHQNTEQVGRRGDDVEQGVLDGIEQRVLQKDVLDRVTRQRELGEHGHGDAVVVTLARDPQHRLGIGGRIRQHRAVGAGGHPHEPVTVGGVEIHGPPIVARHPPHRGNENHPP